MTDRRATDPPGFDPTALRRREVGRGWFLLLEVVTVLTGLAAMAALVIALSVFGSRLDNIQQAREKSALDTCRLIRLAIEKQGAVTPGRLEVVNFAGTPIGYLLLPTGKAQAKQGQDYLEKLGLGNCRRYAHLVRVGTPVAVPPKPPKLPKPPKEGRPVPRPPSARAK